MPHRCTSAVAPPSAATGSFVGSTARIADTHASSPIDGTSVARSMRSRSGGVGEGICPGDRQRPDQGATRAAAFARPVVMGGMKKTMQSTARGGARAGSKSAVRSSAGTGTSIQGMLNASTFKDSMSLLETVDQVSGSGSGKSSKGVLNDIRDGITRLGTIFSKKISGLNKHLAFRLENVSSTLENIAHNIGVMAYNQNILFGKEMEKYSEFQEDEIEDERDESLGKKRGGEEAFSGAKLLDTIKERFNSLIDLLSPKSELGKIGLVGALTLGVMALLPKLEKSLEGVFKFTGEKLIPFLDSIFDIKDDETGEFKWDNILYMSLGAYLALKLTPWLIKKAFLVPALLPGVTKVLGIVGLATWATASIFQVIGDWTRAKDWSAEVGATDNETLNKISGALAGDLEGGIMNSFKNASKWGGIGAFTGFMIGGPVGALVGGVIGAAVGGILGWIGGGQLAQSVEGLVEGIKGIWNNVTQGIKDFFYDREITGPGGETYTQRSGIKQQLTPEEAIVRRASAIYDKMSAGADKYLGSGISDLVSDQGRNMLKLLLVPKATYIEKIKSAAQLIPGFYDKIDESLPNSGEEPSPWRWRFRNYCK